MTAARLYVCPLTKVVETVRASGARSLVSILTAGASAARPREIAPERHLRIALSDIEAAQDGHVLAGRDHVERLLAYLEAWDRREALVIHCYAGVSRSPAAAYVAACALEPRRDELDLARELRRASPTATPNRRLVALADEMLGRRGRMNEAIVRIGRGADCYEGAPFSLELPRAQ